MKLAAVTTVCLAVGATAVAAGVGPAAPSASAGAAQLAQTGCTADAGQALVRTFAARYSAGRVKAALRVWAKEPLFQWFSSGGPQQRAGAEAHKRGTLRAYFRKRARAREQLSLTVLGAGYDPARRIVNFGGELVRSADDHESTTPVPFKGAAACKSGRLLLIVWSM